MLGLQSVFGDVDALLANRLSSKRIVATSIRVLLVCGFRFKNEPYSITYAERSAEHCLSRAY
jgi:hypothetical protein